MSKVFGTKECFSLVREDRIRVIVSYDYVEEPDGINATWYEIYFYKKQVGKPTFQMAKNAILEDINSQTDYKILTAFQWTLTKGWKMENGQKVDLTGETVNVWLSNENQNNYSEGHSIAEKHADEFLPITYKVSEDGAETAIYEDFEDFETLDRFYLAVAAFKNNTLKEGWAIKDAIDWTPYQEALESIDNVKQ